MRSPLEKKTLVLSDDHDNTLVSNRVHLVGVPAIDELGKKAVIQTLSHDPNDVEEDALIPVEIGMSLQIETESGVTRTLVVRVISANVPDTFRPGSTINVQTQ